MNPLTSLWLQAQHKKSVLSVAALTLALIGPDSAGGTPLLGADLASFAVLGASTVTNVPDSAIIGNVGVWSPSGANAVTGFSSMSGLAMSDTQVTAGLVHAGTANAMAGQSDLLTAIANLASMGPGTLLGADLAGLTLAPGIYTVPAGTTNLSGALTLDGHGNANAAWVFQMASTLITSPNAAVHLINTGAGAGLFWNVGSSATLDANTAFLGNVLAMASVTLITGASNDCGRVLAKTGAVTLQQNSLSNDCRGVPGGTPGLDGGLDVTTDPSGVTSVAFLPFAPLNTVPEPGSLALVLLAAMGLALRRSSPGARSSGGSAQAGLDAGRRAQSLEDHAIALGQPQQGGQLFVAGR
jgi:hypothetical protein